MYGCMTHEFSRWIFSWPTNFTRVFPGILPPDISRFHGYYPRILPGPTGFTHGLPVSVVGPSSPCARGGWWIPVYTNVLRMMWGCSAYWWRGCRSSAGSLSAMRCLLFPLPVSLRSLAFWARCPPWSICSLITCNSEVLHFSLSWKLHHYQWGLVLFTAEQKKWNKLKKSWERLANAWKRPSQSISGHRRIAQKH